MEGDTEGGYAKINLNLKLRVFQFQIKTLNLTITTKHTNMKSILLISFLFPTLLFSQITNHFSNQDSKWNVAKSYPAATQEFPSFVATTTKVYGFQGDSTINSEVWSKMYSTSDSLFQNNLVFELQC